MQGIEEQAVGAWLAEHVEGAAAPFRYELIAGGRSNLTFLVTDAQGMRFVLRRPPTGHVLATAHDMAREHRLISAVGKTPVPVPRTLGLCLDETVTGAPFFVMSFVEGEVLDSPAKAEKIPVELRRPLAEHLIDVLADLHQADIDEIGLGDLARREGYVERQLKRWTTQWERSKTRDLVEIDTVAEILRRRLPAQQRAVVAHGDYRFGNCISDITTGRVVAVLDWELCTLGDPLADLGYLGVYWGRKGSVLVSNDPSGAPGFPSFEELVERYAARTGLDVSGVDYYVAFSNWRLAVITEGVYARFLHGAMGDQTTDLDNARRSVEFLATAALDAASRL